MKIISVIFLTKTSGIILLFIVLLIFGIIVRIGNQKSYKKGYHKGVKDIGERIQHDSYWFSYNTIMFNALFMMGESIKAYGYFNPSKLRDEVNRLGDKNILKEIEDENI